ncbi:MAG: PorT family protein [Balneolales bacterium]|nr:PorT family protein [Balneolales bacterium]
MIKIYRTIRNLFFFFLLLPLAYHGGESTAFAQEPAHYFGDPRAGFSFGYTSSGFTGTASSVYDSRTSLMGSFFVNFRLTQDDLLRLQAALGVQPRGATSKFGNVQLDFYSLYLDVPVSVQLSPLASGNLRPYAELGAYYSILIDSEISSGDQSVNITESLFEEDFGILLGGGMIVRLQNRVDLVMGLNYMMGLLDFTIDDNISLRHRNLNAFLALKFGI